MDADIVPPEEQTKGKAWPSAQGSWSLTTDQTHQACREKADTELSPLSHVNTDTGSGSRKQNNPPWDLRAFLVFLSTSKFRLYLPFISLHTHVFYFLIKFFLNETFFFFPQSSTFGSTSSEHLPSELYHLTSSHLLPWPKTPTSLVQMLSHIWLRSSSVPLLQDNFHLFLQLLTACNLCMADNFLWPQKIPSPSILSELFHFHQDHEKLSNKITHSASALGPWGWDAGGTIGIYRWQGYE